MTNEITREATPEEQAANSAALIEIAALFPALNGNDDDIYSFLLSATPYPLSSLPECMPGIRTLAVKSGGNHYIAMTIAELETDVAHESYSRHVAESKLKDCAAHEWVTVNADDRMTWPHLRVKLLCQFNNSELAVAEFGSEDAAGFMDVRMWSEIRI